MATMSTKANTSSPSPSPSHHDSLISFAMSVQDLILECLRGCSSTLRALQKLKSTSIVLEDLVTQLKHVANTLSSINNIFYDSHRDFVKEIESNEHLEKLFQLSIRPCSLIFSAILDRTAITHDLSNSNLRTYLSLTRSLRSALTILTSALQKHNTQETAIALAMVEPMLIDLAERASFEVALPLPPSPASSPHTTLQPVEEVPFIPPLRSPERNALPTPRQNLVSPLPESPDHIDRVLNINWPLPLRYNTSRPSSSQGSNYARSDDVFQFANNDLPFVASNHSSPVGSSNLRAPTINAVKNFSNLHLNKSSSDGQTFEPTTDAPLIPPKAPARQRSVQFRPSSRDSSATMVTNNTYTYTAKSPIIAGLSPPPPYMNTQNSASTTISTPIFRSLSPVDQNLPSTANTPVLPDQAFQSYQSVHSMQNSTSINVPPLQGKYDEDFLHPISPLKTPTEFSLPVTDYNSKETQSKYAALSKVSLSNYSNGTVDETLSSSNSESASVVHDYDKSIIEIDFATLIPSVAPANSSSLPPRFEDIEAKLRQDRAHLSSSEDMVMHLLWAEDILRHCTLSKGWIKRLLHAKCRPAPSSNQANMDEFHEEAVRIVENCAPNTYPRSLFIKARWFELGDDETQNLYLSALSRGQYRAYYYLGKIYESRKDWDTAYEYYKKGAVQGDSACCYRLAKANLKGELGRKKDAKSAIPLLERSCPSADKDAPYGPFLLGMLYTKAYQKSISFPKKLLPPNPFSARAHIIHAASLGLADAQFLLGTAYNPSVSKTTTDSIMTALSARELQMSPDIPLALHYLSLAAMHTGQGAASHAMSQLLASKDLSLSSPSTSSPSSPTPQSLQQQQQQHHHHHHPYHPHHPHYPHDHHHDHQPPYNTTDAAALVYARLAAHSQHTPAFYTLGMYMQSGQGTGAIDLVAARAWYLKAAAAGDKRAVYRLDCLRNARSLALSSTDWRGGGGDGRLAEERVWNLSRVNGYGWMGMAR